ncbi:MAG TPA: CDP-alcohol phosphatidyltransferase family protein, partial [Thermofilum sp.]|nr:CDP-alcohol phosphatidyltransferase family protein [Thermofilum sp.]
MLSKYKYLIEPILKLLSQPFIKLNVDPCTLSLAGFITSLLYVASVWLKAGLGVILILYVTSLVMDSLDGIVARYLGKVTTFGAFLDSTLDRLSDSIYSYSLMELGVANVYEFTVLLIGSYMVSYSRARAEGLGIKMAGVGLGERAERGIIIL